MVAPDRHECVAAIWPDSLKHMRIVSLTPSATEIICAIGGQSQLVGRCHDSDFPPSIKQLPILTQGHVHSTEPGDIDQEVSDLGGNVNHLDSELLQSLKPDLIVTQHRCQVCSVDRDMLMQTVTDLDSKPNILSLDPMSIDDVIDDHARVAEACGLDETAHKVIVDLRTRYWEVRDQVMPYVDGPKVAVIEWVEPLHLAGMWTPGMVRDAGGIPIGPDQGTPSRPIDPSFLIEQDPDLIILAPCGIATDAMAPHKRSLEASRWWTQLQSIRPRICHLEDGTSGFSRPGPRLMDTMERLACHIAKFNH